ncbi:MAG: NAD(P)/FAD-dependent oxidoreductase [Mariniphaga sp.]
MIRYDLAVIGSGPGGFAATMRAVDFGKNVCLIEAGHIGGTGIMNGPLTSKTMWELSVDYSIAAAVDRGYRASGLQVDYSMVKKTVIAAAKTKQYQMLSQIETFSKKNSEAGVITYKRGFAKFLDNNTLQINGENGIETIEADYVIIATGSRPRELHDVPVDQKLIFDSDGLLNLEKFPERMMILGSGIIGCEFATIFSNFGQTEVHLLDRTHRVIPFEDDDVSDFVSNNLEKNGVIIHHTATLRTVQKEKDHLKVVLDYDDGHSQVVEVDIVLVSVGRDANTRGLGLENVGIQPNSKGFLHINDVCAIGNMNDCTIFAAGDVTGQKALYGVAEEQGRFIVEAIFGKSTYRLDYSYMPTLMFFKPELAAIGANEKTLRAKKIPYKAAYYSNELVNRAIAMRSTNGFVKIIVSNDGSEKILGMRAAGPQASAFIVSIAYLINSDIGLHDVLQSIHPHPSVTEGIQECIRIFYNQSIYKPKAFPSLIKVTEWKP